jgi:hypothetical protein
MRTACLILGAGAFGPVDAGRTTGRMVERDAAVRRGCRRIDGGWAMAGRTTYRVYCAGLDPFGGGRTFLGLVAVGPGEGEARALEMARSCWGVDEYEVEVEGSTGGRAS